MSIKLEKLLGLLGDNQWHNISHVITALELPEPNCQQIISFLKDLELIQHDPQTNQIKINQNWKTFLMSNQNTSSETLTQSDAAVGTIIMPPQKTIIVQCTRISNLTDIALELEIRIDKRIREIAINRIK